MEEKGKKGIGFTWSDTQFKSFKKELFDDVKKYFKEAIEEDMGDFTIEQINEIIDEMPINTGEAAAGFTAIHKHYKKPTPKIDIAPGKENKILDGARQSKFSVKKQGNRIEFKLENGVSYAHHLEYGDSKEDPKAMIRRTFNNPSTRKLKEEWKKTVDNTPGWKKQAPRKTL